MVSFKRFLWRGALWQTGLSGRRLPREGVPVWSVDLGITLGKPQELRQRRFEEGAGQIPRAVGDSPSRPGAGELPSAAQLLSG